MATKDKISASHILIMHNESQRSESKITKDEALKKITDIHTKVKEDSALFKDQAMQHSDCSSSEYGGSLGEFGKGVMVKAFEETAFALKVNEISDPFETEFGYHIIKRDS